MARSRNRAIVTYVEVGHAGLFELVPQPARDDFNGNVVGDDPTDAGQGRLDRTETGSGSLWPLDATKLPLHHQTIGCQPLSAEDNLSSPVATFSTSLVSL